jgi:hypothetical protein
MPVFDYHYDYYYFEIPIERRVTGEHPYALELQTYHQRTRRHGRKRWPIHFAFPLHDVRLFGRPEAPSLIP